jgi:hypothetical protein
MKAYRDILLEKFCILLFWLLDFYSGSCYFTITDL